METETETIQRPTSYSLTQIEELRQQIEAMSKFHQIEVLRMLHKYPEVVLNENKSGVRINISDLNPDILFELETFAKYVIAQELYLNNAEKEKEEYKQNFFSK